MTIYPPPKNLYGLGGSALRRAWGLAIASPGPRPVRVSIGLQKTYPLLTAPMPRSAVDRKSRFEKKPAPLEPSINKDYDFDLPLAKGEGLPPAWRRGQGPALLVFADHQSETRKKGRARRAELRLKIHPGKGPCARHRAPIRMRVRGPPFPARSRALPESPFPHLGGQLPPAPACPLYRRGQSNSNFPAAAPPNDEMYSARMFDFLSSFLSFLRSH